ncbi:MAG: hypothetical protein K2I70_03805, partial [Bacilli bacterium]|nr:hypothetical protein [Bacilli bacterium]
ELVSTNDEFLLNFEVTNKNKSIDGDVEIECGPTNNGEAFTEYITSTITPDKFELPATESQEGVLKISLNKINFNEDIEIAYGCKISAVAIGSEDYIGSEEGTISTLGAAKPKVDEKLVPISLANDGTATMVSESDATWYNYSEKRWANAVILVDSPSQIYNEGDTIKEEDIESYFVWIPKYKYRLWNVDTVETSDTSMVHQIDIVFDTEDTKDEEGISCVTPMVAGESGNCDNGEYMTHPAFISLGVNGFWVGKYETGYAGATTKDEAQVNVSDSSKIIVKPNVYSWRGISNYNMFMAAYNYERSLDSHMMKNTEWGAVAYLSHSKYGIGKAININNNSSFKTGYSALASTDQSKYPGVSGDGREYNASYNTSVGYLASTTGNITGIYDMSGGTYDAMSSYVDGNLGKSGFTNETIANYSSKYFDVYPADSDRTTYNYRILGDATGEMSPFSYYADNDAHESWHNSWYNGFSSFVVNSSSLVWFHRGGYYGDGYLADQFNFSNHNGDGDNWMVLASRLVLVG